MEFPYIRVLDFPKHQKRARLLPWIRAGIANPENPAKIIYPLGLIDSGADLTIINREIGEELDYEIESGQEEEIKGLGGGSVIGFIHKVTYLIENPNNPKEIIKYPDIVAFTKNVFPLSYPQQTAIFGTIGFFNHLMVTFMFPHRIIIDTLSS